MTFLLFLMGVFYSGPLILTLYSNHCFAIGYRTTGRIMGLIVEQKPNGADEPIVQYQFAVGHRHLFKNHEVVLRETYDRLHVGERVTIEYFGNRKIRSRLFSPADSATMLRRTSILATLVLLFIGTVTARLARANWRYHAIRTSGLTTIGRVTAVHILKTRNRIKQSLDLVFTDNQNRPVPGHTGYFLSAKGSIWTEGDNIGIYYDRKDSSRFAVNLEEAKK